MNRFKNLVWIFLLLTSLTLLSLFLGLKVYQNWGRQLIYSPENKITSYPGIGQISRFVEERIFVEPKGLGYPIFGKPEERVNYPESDYDVYIIPAQEQLFYTVGVFEGWEDIASEADKYLLIRLSSSGELEKYRVAFAKSDLFKNNPTILGIESVGIRLFTNAANQITKAEPPYLIDLTYEKVKPWLKKGDVVILLPVVEPPDMMKKDLAGNYLASWLILRRIEEVNSL